MSVLVVENFKVTVPPTMLSVKDWKINLPVPPGKVPGDIVVLILELKLSVVSVSPCEISYNMWPTKSLCFAWWALGYTKS